MTTVEAVSFALGAASILLGLLAIWLSVDFYTRDQALFVETQRTLADIHHTARSVEHATELVLARAIDYLAGRPSGAEREDRLGEAVDREFARAVRNVSGGGVATQLTPEMLEELRRTIEQIIAAHILHAAHDHWKGTTLPVAPGSHGSQALAGVRRRGSFARSCCGLVRCAGQLCLHSVSAASKPF